MDRLVDLSWIKGGCSADGSELSRSRTTRYIILVFEKQAWPHTAGHLSMILYECSAMVGQRPRNGAFHQLGRSLLRSICTEDQALQAPAATILHL